MRLICVRTKAEYFSIPGLTRFRKIRSDLPLVPSYRRLLHKIVLALETNQHVARMSVSDMRVFLLPGMLPRSSGLRLRARDLRRAMLSV
jgi:hypothetical protein